MHQKLNCILLIDDDEPTNYLNRKVLEEAGSAYHIQIAESGQDALDYLMGNRPYGRSKGHFPHPDLIFLDINMPGMDGWEFLEKYSALPEEQKAEVIMIMLTTSLNPDDKRKAAKIPLIAGYENKPLIQLRVKEILEKYFPG
ncbi:response regulator [Flavitalea flava]